MIARRLLCSCIVVGVLVWFAPAMAQAPAAAPASALPSLPPELEQVRAALSKYQDPIVAVHDGYFSTLACIEFPTAGGPGELPYPAGGMGVHFLNAAFIGPTLDPAKPQVLIYEQVGDKLQLVAAEWFAPVQPGVTTAPQIFGRALEGPMEGHHPIMPPELHHWDLHVWLWKANPAGVFAATNPNVRCATGAYTFRERAPKVLQH